MKQRPELGGPGMEDEDEEEEQLEKGRAGRQGNVLDDIAEYKAAATP